ncbi:conserved hypothetical protein [Culex quinquefasciatus]|uniref:Uncharacterized protein n=1 Tax=Culex quinquefasciatus TaxID=7176 RepID=B0XCI4_CULQU|nr:conserved hypothetical protein [Culex quinquefasciatus]|eukprot:XP_001867356.1 conserved hypothetical protein [Culex quinquefasciatus]
MANPHYIETSNETIASLRERIKRVERRLIDAGPGEDAYDRPEVEELVAIKKLLEDNEQKLHKLHKENSKSFAIAACLFFVCFLIYGIYVLLTNGA